MSLFNLFELGSPFSWILLIFALFASVLCLERFIFLHKGQIRVAPFVNGILNLINQNRQLEALTLCQSTPGPVARIIKSALAENCKNNTELLNVLKKNAMLELPDLEKRIGSILFIAQISPMIGLAGTLYSFLQGFLNVSSIETYVKMTTYSNYIISSIAVTLLSVILSVLCFSCFHFLRGRIKAILFDIDWTINQIYLTKNNGSGH